MERIWHKQRFYAHFDRPLQYKEALCLAENPERVIRHAFWPLIVRPSRSITRKLDATGARRKHTKIRPIAYAAHSDSHIYSYYANLLSFYLEQHYERNKLLNNAVLAYRKFPIPKNNIHFSFEVFEKIKEMKECDVVALDVEGFFDNLDHVVLKKLWKIVLGQETLPNDHYAVYKACTKSTGILISTLRDIFGGEVRRKRGRGAVLCSVSEFRDKVTPHLQPLFQLVSAATGKAKANQAKGIPQGLPISAVLANLYMLEVDEILADKLHCMGGIYKRYSDDIMLVVPVGEGVEAEKLVKSELQKLRLKIQDKKTQRNRFSISKNYISEMDENFNTLNDSSRISYLGFDFDGRDISVRDSTVSRFMMKAIRAIRRAKIAAKKSQGVIKKRQLYARFTALGYGKAYGKGVYAKGVLPRGAPRIGFFNYMRMAKKITGSRKIERQMVQINNRVYRLIKSAERKI